MSGLQKPVTRLRALCHTASYLAVNYATLALCGAGAMAAALAGFDYANARVMAALPQWGDIPGKVAGSVVVPLAAGMTLQIASVGQAHVNNLCKRFCRAARPGIEDVMDDLPGYVGTAGTTLVAATIGLGGTIAGGAMLSRFLSDGYLTGGRAIAAGYTGGLAGAFIMAVGVAVASETIREALMPAPRRMSHNAGLGRPRP